MSRVVICLLLFMCLLTGHAMAGAWPREPKQIFLSTSVERDTDGNAYASLYAEYGLADRRVLGVEIGHTDVGETNALIWLQRPLGTGEGPNQWSYALGGGAIERDGEFLPLGQATLSWGRGFQDFWNGGWLSADARIKVAGRNNIVRQQQGLSAAEFSYLTPETTAKLDLTAGFHASDSLMLISQFRFEWAQDSDFSAKFAGSVVRDLWGPAKIELGAVLPITGPGEKAVKIGLWFEI